MHSLRRAFSSNADESMAARRVHHALSRPVSSRWLLVLAVGGAVAGCDNLLDVDVPSQVIADNLNNPEAAPLLVHSAQTDFGVRAAQAAKMYA